MRTHAVYAPTRPTGETWFGGYHGAGQQSARSAMTYEELKDFLQVRMRMSHVYQPLMIRELLTVGGRASTRQIAADIRDAFPVTPMHSLVIPRRHVSI